MNDRLAILDHFIGAIEDDARVTTAHISLFLYCWCKAVIDERGMSFRFYRRDVLGLCRISSPSTFHKIIQQLHAFGYIRYAPSFNRFKMSSVTFYMHTNNTITNE